MIKYTVVEIPNGDIRLSPSGLGVFFRNPREWIDNLEGMNAFKGNKYSELGTCVHYLFEGIQNGTSEVCYWDEVETHLQSSVDNEIIQEIEMREILGSLRKSYSSLVDWRKSRDESTVLISEPTVRAKLPIGIVGSEDVGYWVAGSIDAIVEDEFGNLGIRDYKVTGRKMSSIEKYKMQLLAYAIAWNSTNTNKVRFIEIVNINITKTKGVQISIIKEEINQEALDAMYDVFKMVCVKHRIYVKNPKLRPYLYTVGVDYSGNFKLGESNE